MVKKHLIGKYMFLIKRYQTKQHCSRVLRLTLPYMAGLLTISGIPPKTINWLDSTLQLSS